MIDDGALSQITLSGVTKSYGTVPALAETDLEVRRGEFFSLLGPSGCGKSTLLKIIAGFERPDTGRVTVGGVDMTLVPPERRKIGFVFQNYALFPQMNVYENVAFGLRARRAERIDETVRGAISMVELGGLERRRPHELSGGQQQRVALARAIAIGPDVLLLDEPLAALDKQLRQSMQRKLVELQRSLGITTIFVTHDQEEALTMSDRVAVMSARTHRIEQMGTPREIYRRPSTRMVSMFLGHSNLLEDEVVEHGADGGFRTRLGFHGRDHAAGVGSRVCFSLRPERIRIAPDPVATTAPALAGEVLGSVFVGDGQMYHVRTDAGPEMKIRTLDDGGDIFDVGRRVWLSWPDDAAQQLHDKIEGEDE